MRRTIYIVVAWLLMLASAAPAQVTWLGDRPEDARTVERRIQSLATAGSTIESLADSASAWLQSQGYLDVETFVLDSALSIAAGGRVYLRQLTVYDLDTATMATFVPFTSDEVEAAIDARLSVLRDLGFVYARAVVEKVVRGGLSVNLRVTIDRGPRVHVASLNLRGLTRSRPKVVARYLDFNLGDSLTDRSLNDLERRAAGIPFVRFKPPATVQTLPGYTEAVVTLDFDEKRQFNLAGGAGYIPGENNGLVWNLDLKLLNLFGAGRELQVQSERREEHRNNLQLGYAQPVFLLGPDRLAVRVATRDYRDYFYEFSLFGSYTTLYRRTLSTGLGVGWRRVEPADESASYSAYSIESTLGRSNLDNRLNPQDGYDLTAALGYTYRRYAERDSAGSQAFNETRAKLSAHFYRPVKGRLIGYLGLNYRGLETGEAEPPLSELFLIGGPGSLRGWRNEQFAAQRTAFGTFETRLRFERAYLFAFYDGAYVNRRLATDDGGSVLDELYRSGFGLGMAVIDRERSVVMSLGWNDQDGFDQPRLSVEFSADL